MDETEAVNDDLLTVVGLFLESHAALVRVLERRLVEDTGLTVPSFEVLIRLVRSPDQRLRLSDLAAQTTLTPSGLTRAIDRLEEAGYVRREACPSDRRGTYATLTDAGKARMCDAVPVHVEHIRATLGSALADDELAALASTLRTLRDRLNPNAAAGSC